MKELRTENRKKVEPTQHYLSMNVDKTVFTVMRPRHSEAVSVFFDGSPLKEVEQHRCLSVLVDCRLSWCDHARSVAAKVSQRIGCLKRVSRQLSSYGRRLFFQAVNQRCLEYCSAITCTQLSYNDINRLLSLFNRGVRVAAGVAPDTDVGLLLQSQTAPV